MTDSQAPAAVAERPDSSHGGSRFWGEVEVILETPTHRINRLTIKPKHTMRTQLHFHRSEHWVVVSGTAKIQCGDQEFLLNRNESSYVPPVTLHSVENPGTIPLVMIEVQIGEYLGEDDIERPLNGAAG
jgi:mannose-6-phosphate isomerase